MFQRLNCMVNYNEKTINGAGIYLSKKIAIPSNTELQCVEWNYNTNYVATGGTNGTLKVVRLAPLDVGSGREMKGIGGPTNLSVNQNLEGHSGAVMCLNWNEVNQKLTSSDANGLITVWSLHNESWYEEMINNRNKSVVVGMAWNVEGSKIAIAYQDGQVIVGTNDGNRIWNKDLPNGLAACEWSPEGSMLLFGLQDGEVHTYDMNGVFLQKLHMVALENVELEAALAKDLRKDNIITLKWWSPVPKSRMVEESGYHELQPRPRMPRMTSFDATMPMEPRQADRRPRLMVAYEHGVIQLMRSDQDTSPIVARFNQLTISCARWSPNGAFIAVAGSQTDQTPSSERSSLHIMSAYGVKLCMLRVPGHSLTGCAWDPTGLRVALSIDSNLYFANIRPQYKWGYCGQTVIYSYEREDRNECRIVFYETKLEEAYPRSIRGLEQLACWEDYCVLISRQNDPQGMYMAQLCNGIGTPLDSKFIDVDPKCVALNGTAAVVAGAESYFIWHFVLPKRNTMGMRAGQQDHAEDVIHMLDSGALAGELGMRRKRGNDSISAICMGDDFFLAVCESGALFRISLSDGSVQQRYQLPPNIMQMQLNASNKRVATLDQQNTLQLFDLAENSVNKVPNMDKKDVWSFRWDTEKDDAIAYNEKTKMIVMRGEETEEPVNCSGYICQFKGLAVRTVLVDYFLLHPESPEKKFVIDIEIKSLRDAKFLLERMKIHEATQFIEKNPHPKLWGLLAEVALNRLDISTAEHAYVMLGDYCGLQFCKRLANIQSAGVKRAEVAAHLGKLEEAERIYVENDRRDLAIEMYRKAHEWIKVLHLLNQGGVGGANEDALRHEAWNRVGDYYADRQKWDMASKHYEQTRNLDKLFFCYVNMDEHACLETLSKQLEDNHPLLKELGFLFGSAGMADQSVDCYTRCGMVKEALDVCIQLNQWDRAVQLSRIHNLRDVDSLLGKYAAELNGSSEKSLAAVQLYRRAGKFLKAARIVFEIADGERKRVADCIRLKKLYVMGALLVEEYHEQNKTKMAEKYGKTEKDASVALSGLLASDVSVSLEDSRMIDQAWRGALAYHFFMLAQRQLYEGNTDAAMKTSVHLIEYEDLIDAIEVYSLLALSSCANRQFALASRAFLKLETLENNDAKAEFQELALKIFSKYPPTDTRPHQSSCPNCHSMVPDYAQYCTECDTKFAICISSGAPLMADSFWLCPVCRQRADNREMARHSFCPLCHVDISRST